MFFSALFNVENVPELMSLLIEFMAPLTISSEAFPPIKVPTASIEAVVKDFSPLKIFWFPSAIETSTAASTATAVAIVATLAVFEIAVTPGIPTALATKEPPALVQSIFQKACPKD